MDRVLVVMVILIAACRVGGSDGDADAWSTDADVEVDGDVDAGDADELATGHCAGEAEDPVLDPQICCASPLDVSADEQDPDLSDGYQHRIGYAALGHCPGDEVLVTVRQGDEVIHEELTVVSSSSNIGLPWVTLATHNGSASIEVETGRTFHHLVYEVVGF